MNIKLLVEGGNMKPGPALSQKLGPAGINMGQVISKVNESTKDLKGMEIPIEIEVNISTKEFDVKVFSPSVSALLKKELGIEKGSGMQKKTKVANISIEQIISIAKTKMPNLLDKTLKSAVKSVVGTCVSLGILVENKSPREIEMEIDEGKYDREINEEITESSEEKKKFIKEHFDKVKKEQEELMKKEQAAKEAEEKEKEVAEKEKVPEKEDEKKEEKKPEAKKK